MSALAVACTPTNRDPLVIEVVPTVLLGFPVDLPAATTQALSTTRAALEILGVEPDEYVLVAGDIAPLTCGQPSPGAAMECAHPAYGPLSADWQSWDRFAASMPEPPNGTVRLMVIQHEVVLDGSRDYARGHAKSSMDMATWNALHYGFFAPVVDSDHYSQQTCRVITSPAVGTVAHELGHCFGLAHNEGDPDNLIDVMAFDGSGPLWLKPANRTVVRRFFRDIEAQ